MDQRRIDVICPRCQSAAEVERGRLRLPVACTICGNIVQMCPAADFTPTPIRDEPLPYETQPDAPGPSRVLSILNRLNHATGPAFRGLFVSCRAALSSAAGPVSHELFVLCRVTLSIVAGLIAASSFILFIAGINAPAEPELRPLWERILFFVGICGGLGYVSYRSWPSGLRLSLPGNLMYCVTCGVTGKPRREVRGHFLLEVIAWIAGIALAIPTLGLGLLIGPLYSLSRHLSRRRLTCRACGSDSVIPPDSPRAQELSATDRRIIS